MSGSGHQPDIKSIRAKHGWSIKELADMLGVSPRTVESWEQGRRNPSKSARMLLQIITRKGGFHIRPISDHDTNRDV